MFRSLLFLIGCSLFVPPSVLGQRMTDAELLQGHWQVISIKGKKPDPVDPIEFRIFGQDIELADEFHATFSLDPTQRPRHIDLHVSAEGNRVLTLPAIYRVDGDTLHFAICKLTPPRRDGELAKPGLRPGSLRPEDGQLWIAKRFKVTSPLAFVGITGSGDDPFGGIGVSHDGKRAAILVADEIVFWDLQKQALIDRGALPEFVEYGVRPKFRFMPDQRYVLVGQHLYDLVSRKFTGPVEFDWLYDVSQDGRLLLTSGHDEFKAPLAIVEAASRKVIRKIQTNAESYETGPKDARFSRDGKTMVSIEDHLLSIWDAKTLKRRHQVRLRGDEDDDEVELQYLAISADGERVAAAAKYPDRVGVWNVDDGRLLRVFECQGETRELAFVGDSHQLVTSFAKGFHVWDADTGKLLRSIRMLEDLYRTFQVTPDGKLLLTSTGAGSRVLSLEGHRDGPTVVYPPAELIKDKKFRSAATTSKADPPAIAAKAPRLKIIKATFGLAKKSVDVTKTVLAAIAEGEDKTVVSAKGLKVEDPAPRRIKKLVIEYEFDGRPLKKSFKAGPKRKVNLRDVLLAAEDAGAKSLKTVKGWKVLFNGNNLKGWTGVHSEISGWKIKDGVLQSPHNSLGGGWLAAPGNYQDFELQLQFRVSPEANSGVFLRAPEQASYPHIEGLEVQVRDDAQGTDGEPSSRCGALLLECAPSESASKSAGEWQTLSVECIGPKVRVVLNSVEVVNRDLSETEPLAPHAGRERKSGRIGLQDRGEKVEFRNIRVRRL